MVIMSIQTSSDYCILLSCHMCVLDWAYTLQLPNVKELLAPNRCDISSLSGSNGIRNQNHLVCTRNWPAKLAKWLSCVEYLSVRWFDCMLLSCHVSVSEWIYTLQLPECLKQVRYVKFKRLQRNSKPQAFLVCKRTLNHLANRPAG